MENKGSSIRELRRLVQESCRNNPHLTSRLEKAALLMLMRPIVPLGDHHYQIGSEDGLRFYEVINGHCECHDYIRHGPDHPCKHRLALALYQRLECSGQPTLFPRGSTQAMDPLAAEDVPLE